MPSASSPWPIAAGPADVEQARAVVHDVAELRSGRQTIAVLKPLVADLLPRLVSQFHRQFPRVLLSRVSADVSDRVGCAVHRSIRHS
jgi:DNA-binding transcriptional LysR family regulator